MGPYNLEVTSDGKLLIATYKSGAYVAMWDLTTGEEVARIKTTRRIPHGVAVSDDDKYAFVTLEGVGGEPGTSRSTTSHQRNASPSPMSANRRADCFLEGSTMKQAAIVLTLLFVSVAVWAQEEPAEPRLTLEVEPSELNLKVGEKATLVATVLDADGNIVERPVVFFSRRRRSVSINPAGIVEAYRPGEHVLIAMLPKDPEDLHRRADPLLTVEVPVTIPNPPAASVEFVELPSAFYAGTIAPIETRVTDTAGANRPDVEVRLETSDESVASLDELGALSFKKAGMVRDHGARGIREQPHRHRCRGGPGHFVRAQRERRRRSHR